MEKMVKNAKIEFTEICQKFQRKKAYKSFEALAT